MRSPHSNAPVTHVLPIPWSFRIGYTIWMIFWTPLVLHFHGAQNFLWLCNLAQFFILLGLWSENRLLLSSQAGLMLIVGLGWGLDLIVAYALGGRSLTGFTTYMFDGELPLPARLISFYHLGVPVLMLGVLVRTGYDRRGPWLQSLLGAPALLGALLLTDPERNVNWLHRIGDQEQTWLPDPLYALLLCVAYPLLLYFPGHGLVLLLLRLLKR